MKLCISFSLILLLATSSQLLPGERRVEAHQRAAEKHGAGHPAGESHLRACQEDYRSAGPSEVVEEEAVEVVQPSPRAKRGPRKGAMRSRRPRPMPASQEAAE